MTINLSHFYTAISLQTVSDSCLNGYILSWRQRKLIVKASQPSSVISLPPLSNLNSLVQCLQRSPIQLVTLDLALGPERLTLWAEACHQAKKPAYLQIPSSRDLPQIKHPRRWLLKRVLDWLAAILLLGLVAPSLVAIALVLYIDSPGPIWVKRWQVSQRGRLFLCYYFRTQRWDGENRSLSPRLTRVGQFLNRHRLHKLPQLIHVLRGEMSLIGSRSCPLEDAAKIKPAFRSQLNALPGMIGAYPARVHSNLSDLIAVNQNAVNYLESWSLLRDLKALFSSLPRLFLAG